MSREVKWYLKWKRFGRSNRRKKLGRVWNEKEKATKNMKWVSICKMLEKKEVGHTFNEYGKKLRKLESKGDLCAHARKLMC